MAQAYICFTWYLNLRSYKHYIKENLYFKPYTYEIYVFYKMSFIHLLDSLSTFRKVKIFK